MKIQRKLALGLIGAVAALALGSIAWAAIPDPRGMINACYDKQSGALRVSDSQTGQPKTCGAKESPLAWSQQGPAGPQGPQGVPGPQGPAGPAGGLPTLNTETVGTVTLAGINGGNPLSIRGFSWSASNTGSNYGGGAGNKTTIDDVELVRSVDPASPALIGDTLSGLHRQTAVVDLFTPGTQTPYARYTLTDVTVTKVAHSGGDETFTLHPAQISEQSLAGATPPALPAESEMGTLTLAGVPDALPVSSLGFEVDGPSGLTPATTKPLRVDLAHGAASPKLVQDALTGLHLQTATLQTSKATYTMTDVVVRSVRDEATGAAGSIPTERITLEAAQVQVTAP